MGLVTDWKSVGRESVEFRILCVPQLNQCCSLNGLKHIILNNDNTGSNPANTT
jgi:hypothetical protein